MQAEETQLTGAEQVAWDLSDLYSGVDDPAIAGDMQRADDAAAALERDYRGKVATLSPDALAEAVSRYEQIIELATKVGSFAHLIWSTRHRQPAIRRAASEGDRVVGAA